MEMAAIRAIHCSLREILADTRFHSSPKIMYIPDVGNGFTLFAMSACRTAIFAMRS